MFVEVQLQVNFWFLVHLPLYNTDITFEVHFITQHKSRQKSNNASRKVVKLARQWPAEKQCVSASIPFA